MRPLDIFLAQKIAEANDPEGFRSLVMEAAGVRPEARDFIRQHSGYGIDATKGQGWSPPLLPDGSFDLRPEAVGTVNMNYWEAQGTLHECAHVWFHWWVRQTPMAMLSACWLPVAYAKQYGPAEPLPVSALDPADVAVFGQPDAPIDKLAARIAMNKLGSFSDFIRGYVYGIGRWPGMYYDTATGQHADLDEIERDMHLINWWEILAGISSWCMGRFKDGPHRIPKGFWWLYRPLFTGEIQATPG